MIYMFPRQKRERPVSVQTMPVTLPPCPASSDIDITSTLNQFGLIIVSDEFGEEDFSSDSEDLCKFHVQFPNEDALFPETPIW